MWEIAIHHFRCAKGNHKHVWKLVWIWEARPHQENPTNASPSRSQISLVFCGHVFLQSSFWASVFISSDRTHILKPVFPFDSGSIKVWDFGSGQLYKSYPDEQSKKRHEDTITGLAYHTMYSKRCLLVSSWGKKIRIMEVSKFYCFKGVMVCFYLLVSSPGK